MRSRNGWPCVQPSTLRPGDEATIEVTLAIADGYHLYGSLDETGQPTTLTVTEAGPLRIVGDAEVPTGEPHAAGQLMSFWIEGSAVLRQRVKVPADAASGTVRIGLRVDYMTCTEDFCDPASSLETTAVLEIEAAGDGSGATTAHAAPSDATPTGPNAGRIAFRTRVEPEVARPGETVDVIVSVSVADGWHTFGNGDRDAPELVATSAQAAQPRGGNRLPNGEPSGDRQVLSGGFELRQAFAIPKDAEPGDLPLGMRVDYLLADADGAVPAASHEFSLPLVIEAGPVRTEYNGAAFITAEFGGWWGLILLAIGAGLFALLMPCTYPMIPITISLFSKQAEARGGKVLPLSLTYGAGIVAIFVLIGLLAGPYIVPVASHWLTNTVIAVFFIVFALSLFGLIELRPPAFLLNAAGKAHAQGGYVGVLLMGATLVVTSFTCTVPFVASLIALAAQGGTAHVIVGMGTFGLTMAIPFVALSLLPGRLRAMPRAGEWMNTLKVFLGFVELAAALKFVSNVDIVVNAGPVWLPRSLFLWIWTLLFAAAGLHLLSGFLRATAKPGWKRAVGVAFCFAFAGYCAYGATGNRLNPVMTAIAPPLDLGKHTKVKDDYDAALATALAQNKLLLVNFTGFACVNCRVMEDEVLPSAQVAELLERNYVEARIHTDHPTQGTENRALQQSMVSFVASPYYVIVDPATGLQISQHQLSGVGDGWDQVRDRFAAFLREPLRGS